MALSPLQTAKKRKPDSGSLLQVTLFSEMSIIPRASGGKSSDPFSFTMQWEETNFVFNAQVNGFRNEELRVQFREKKLLLIIGESVSFGRFTQTIQLPENVNVERSLTVVNNGKLTVTVPVVNRHLKKKKHAAMADSGRRNRRLLC